MMKQNTEITNEIETRCPNDSSLKSQHDYSWKKYIILICISLLNLANGFQEDIIPNEFRDDMIEQYKVTEKQINLFSYIFPLSFVIATGFSVSLVENLNKFRFVNSISVASTFTILGCLFRIFVNTNLLLACFGQMLCGLATPFILFTPLKIATTLFASHQRIFAISVILTFNSVGILLSLIFPMIFFNLTLLGAPFEIIVKNYFTYTFYLSLICIPNYFIILLKPIPNVNILVINFINTNSDSISSEEKEKTDLNKGCCNNLKILLRNSSFVYLLISFTCIYGFFKAYSRKVSTVFKMYDMDSIEFIEILATSAGIVASILIACLIDKIKHIKCALITLIVISLCYFAVITVLFILQNNDYEIPKLLYASLYIVYNMSLSPIYSLCYYLIYEMTYPNYHAVSLGLMFGLSMIGSIFFSFILDYVEDGVVIHLIAIGLVMISLVFVIFMKEHDTFVRHEEPVTVTDNAFNRLESL